MVQVHPVVDNPSTPSVRDGELHGLLPADAPADAPKKSGDLVAFLKSAKERKDKLPSKRIMVKKSQRSSVQELFDSLDDDGDGLLTQEELTNGLSKGCVGAIDETTLGSILSHAIEKADQDDDGLLDIDEFMSLFVVEKPHFIDTHHRHIQYFLSLAFFAIAPLVYIPLNEAEDGTRWSMWDALYFAAVTVTTVGYGDLGPNNDTMKLFTVFYILFGLIIVASVVNDCVQAIVALYEEKMKKFNMVIMEGMKTAAAAAKEAAEDAAEKIGLDDDPPPGTPKEKGQVHKHASKAHSAIMGSVDTGAIKKLWYSLMLFALPVLIGTVFFKFNEDWSFVDSFYWSVVTCTTVGYGDMSLTQESSKIFSFFYILIGFGFVAAAIGNVGAIQMERAIEHKKRDFLRTTLSSDLLKDLGQDGKTGVDRCEFLCAMLLQLGKLNEEDLLPILTKFDELDVDQSGHLTKEDIRLMRLRRAKTRMEQKAADGKQVEVPVAPGPAPAPVAPAPVAQAWGKPDIE